MRGGTEQKTGRDFPGAWWKGDKRGQLRDGVETVGCVDGGAWPPKNLVDKAVNF